MCGIHGKRERETYSNLSTLEVLGRAPGTPPYKAINSLMVNFEIMTMHDL